MRKPSGRRLIIGIAAAMGGTAITAAGAIYASNKVRDYVIWERSFDSHQTRTISSSTSLPYDADGDHDVDMKDYESLAKNLSSYASFQRDYTDRE